MLDNVLASLYNEHSLIDTTHKARNKLTSLYDIIYEIESAEGSNAKTDVIKKYKDDNLMVAYFYAMFSPHINFGIKKYNTHIDDPEHNFVGLEFDQAVLQDVLQNLAERKLTGNAAIDWLENLAQSLSVYGRKLLFWLIDRSIRGGVGAKMINKAMGMEYIWCPDNHYMRCSLMTEKLLAKIDWSNMVLQQKFDGAFHDVGRLIGCRTRSGNVYPKESLPISQADIDKVDGILSGEIVLYENGVKLDRKTSNGMLNSALSGTPIDKKYKAVYHVWDWRTDDSTKCNLPYSTRLQYASEIVKTMKGAEMAETIEVASYEDALCECAKLIAAGEEGGVLKCLDMPWESGTSKKQIKMKVECDIDLLATELVAGDENGKHADTFGSIRCQTSDGGLVVNVTGLSDDIRKTIADDPSQIIGKVVTVTFNDIISSREKRDYVSLFLPRFGKVKGSSDLLIRHDKVEADSTERVYEIFEAQTGINKRLTETA